MDAVDCIKTRRSRRKYLEKNVSDEIINKLIDAARRAPFGGPPIKDCQLVDFIIIRDEKIKKELVLGFEESEFIKTAPVVIAVCADLRKDCDYQSHEITASLAIQNLLLAAHALGLGACYTSTFIRHIGHKKERKKLYEILKLPDYIELISVIPVGYPDSSEKIKKKELRDIKEMIHHDKW